MVEWVASRVARLERGIPLFSSRAGQPWSEEVVCLVCPATVGQVGSAPQTHWVARLCGRGSNAVDAQQRRAAAQIKESGEG